MQKRGGRFREKVLLRWLDLYSKFSLFCRFFCTFVCILTKPRFQTKMITEPKNWKVNIVHIWRLIIYFFRSWVLLHSPRQISGLPKLPPFPRTPSEVAIMRKAMKSWELKRKLRKVFRYLFFQTTSTCTKILLMISPMRIYSSIRGVTAI